MPSEFSPIIDAGLHRQRSPWITVAALCPLPALTTLESSLRSLPPNFSTVACAGSADIDCGFDFDASYSEWSQRFSDEDDTSPIPPPSSGTLSVLSLPTMIRDCSVDSDGGEDEDDAVTPSDDAEPQLDGSSSLYTCDEVASNAISAFGDKLLQSTSPDVNMQDVKEEEEEEDSTQASGDSDAEVGDINTESEESIEEETNLSHKVTTSKHEFFVDSHIIRTSKRNAPRSTRKCVSYADTPEDAGFDSDHEPLPLRKGRVCTGRRVSPKAPAPKARVSTVTSGEKKKRPNRLPSSKRRPRKASSPSAHKSTPKRLTHIELSQADFVTKINERTKSTKGNEWYPESRVAKLHAEADAAVGAGIPWFCPCGKWTTGGRHLDSLRHLTNCHMRPVQCIGVLVEDQHLYRLLPSATRVTYMTADGKTELRVGGCGALCGRKDAKKRHASKRNCAWEGIYPKD